MDFHSVMETFAEAWVAANTQTPLTEAAEQGLINGPNNTGYGTSGGSSAPTLHDLSNERREPEAIVDNDSNRIPEHQSPSDNQNTCHSLSELKSPEKVVSVSHGKSMPVHCIVEHIPGPQACGQYVELDSYAIIPQDTLFCELVRTALVKLGYSVSQVLGAKGSIQIKKWKPLAFDQITENSEATVVDILGDLTTVATLHIRLYSVPDNPQEWIDTTVRNAVLELLREMSQSKLAKLCPLSQPMLSNIINNRYVGKIGKEKCQEFGTWYLNYRKQNPEAVSPEVVPTDRPQDGRLTFHPTKELPMMRSWFHGCRNPSRRTLQMYVDILNQGPVRQQERPKVVVSALKNWWKNEKQRERKSRKVEEGQHLPPKVKKKHNTREDDDKSKESCGGLQELSVAEPQRAAELDSKFPILNCNNQISSELDKFSKGVSLIDSNSSTAEVYKINHVQNNVITKCPGIVEDTNIFHKLHSVCLIQNNSIFDHFPGFHNKNYSNSLSRNLPATEIGKEISNHSESEVDIDVGT